MSRDLQGLIGELEASAGDPRNGLPEDVFLLVSRLTPLVNVDLLIQDERGRTLLTWRDDEFYGAGWHIPGGIIRFKERAADRIRACAREEIGTSVSWDAMPILVAESIGERASRGHFLSLLFRCRLAGSPDASREATTDPPSPRQWRWHQGAPVNLIPAQAQYAAFL